MRATTKGQTQRVFDHLIVGAGAAGSVIAARLTEDAARDVCLIEAGPDAPPGAEPADVRNIFPLSMFNEARHWPDTFIHPRTAGDGPAMPMPQGKLVGGSSAIMGMWAMRGCPQDYDQWAAEGAAGWDWQGVAPYFRKLEADQDFAGPDHGQSGPVPIVRTPPGAWPPISTALHQALQARGWAFVEDMNADFRDGETVLPISRYAASRAAGGICYLTNAVRARPNFTLSPNIEVRRLVFEGRRAVGVAARLASGEEVEFRAREVILAAGALRTPQILLRSGVGAGAALRDAGIETVVDRPGVGQRLQNHPLVSVIAFLTKAGREARGWRPAGATYLRWTTGLPDTGFSDMGMYVRSYLTWHALGRRMAALTPTLTRPAAFGAVRLDPAAPKGPARIEFNFLGDDRDLVRMMAGVRLAVELFGAPPVSAVTGEPLVMTRPYGVMRYNRLSRLNALRGLAAATLLDASPRRGGALVREAGGMSSAVDLVADDRALETFVRRGVIPAGHVSGTCRMGRPDDPGAVTDPEGRVYGVEGLRVADASLMPCVPSGNTHIPTLMVAEKVADSIRARPA